MNKLSHIHEERVKPSTSRHLIYVLITHSFEKKSNLWLPDILFKKSQTFDLLTSYLRLNHTLEKVKIISDLNHTLGKVKITSRQESKYLRN